MARTKAKRLSATIPLCKQPLARGKLSVFCELFEKHHRFVDEVHLHFHHRYGRKKRGDTMIEWYPLKLYRQPRADPLGNVRRLLNSVHAVLQTDLTGLSAYLTVHGAIIHGNTRAKKVLRTRPRGASARRRAHSGAPAFRIRGNVRRNKGLRKTTASEMRA